MHHPTDSIAYTPLLHQSWINVPASAPTTHCTMSERSYHGATSRSNWLIETRVTWSKGDANYDRNILVLKSEVLGYKKGALASVSVTD